MSAVDPHLDGARVLDLFAGSGALGLEALSRGAAHATFVEQAPSALQSLRANLTALGAAARAEVVRADAIKYVAGLEAGAFNLAFADPPYAQGFAAALAEAFAAVPFAGLLGVEHSVRDEMPDGGERRRYGTTAITFYRR